MKFRKKPVVVEASQWFKNGDHPEDGDDRFTAGEFAGEKLEGKVVRYYRRPDVPGSSQCEQCGMLHDDHGWIDTLEQGHRVCPGDWIITGVEGERYPIKDGIFRRTYEAIPDPNISVQHSAEKLQQLRDFVYWEQHNVPDKTHIAEWALAEIERLMARAKELDALLYAVQRKFPGETRLQTALRYIKEVETQPSQAASAAKAGE